MAHYSIQTYDQPQAFLDRADPWLLQNEPAYNLTLGIARALVTGDSRYKPPIFLATIEQDGDVVGTAFRTPPHKLCITEVPLGAVDQLVEEVGKLYDSIPAVLGPKEPAYAIAKAWCKSKGGQPKLGREQGIYAATEVIHPPNPPAGHLRLATEDDYDLMVAWIEGFVRDIEGDFTQPAQLVRIRLDQEGLYVWEDAGPKSLVAVAGATPNGARVGPVYTPDAYRGKGYASITTAQVTEKVLTSGKTSCFLYTDLANPTSNSIYMKIGYQLVCDVVDVEISSS